MRAITRHGGETLWTSQQKVQEVIQELVDDCPDLDGGNYYTKAKEGGPIVILDDATPVPRFNAYGGWRLKLDKAAKDYLRGFREGMQHVAAVMAGQGGANLPGLYDAPWRYLTDEVERRQQTIISEAKDLELGSLNLLLAITPYAWPWSELQIEVKNNNGMWRLTEQIQFKLPDEIETNIWEEEREFSTEVDGLEIHTLAGTFEIQFTTSVTLHAGDTFTLPERHALFSTDQLLDGLGLRPLFEVTSQGDEGSATHEDVPGDTNPVHVDQAVPGADSSS